MSREVVLILGASDHPEKYAHKAMTMLLAHGHEVVLVHPTLSEIEGHKVFKSIDEISQKIDTLTMYVNPKISSSVAQSILKLKPGRVIFNPGTENPELEVSLKRSGIDFEEACTLVLLTTGQF